jgi:hypothetical protein
MAVPMIARRVFALLLLLAALPAHAQTIAKAFADGEDLGFSTVTSITSDAFDSTSGSGYTHLVAFATSQDGESAITFSDNASSGAWTCATQRNHASTTLSGRMCYVKIGTPRTGHTVTAAWASANDFKALLVWMVDSSTGEVAVDAQDDDEGTGTAADAGTLSTTGASVVSFLGIGIDSTAFVGESTGWTEDADTNPDFGSKQIGYSRGPETTTPIDPAGTINASRGWVAYGLSLRVDSGGGGSSIVPKAARHQLFRTQ